ncbi:Wzy polymerase domain-containing protein [Pantoea sp. CS_6]|uniref:PglL family O-oligosaccharyltransferase n=1 Tax=Pantoea sp. CS_6 TaxID=3055795 RepID=UPI0035C08D2C
MKNLSNNETMPKVQVYIFGVIIFWLCGGFLYAFPNSGGLGLSLPQNILTWLVIALVLLLCTFSIKLTGARLSPFTGGERVILLGVVLWSFPLFLTRDFDWYQNALPRVIALLVLIVFYFTLGHTLSRRLKCRYLFLHVIVNASLLQAGYAILQFVLSPGERPYGSFQQVNVLSTFLATGLVCLLFIFNRSKAEQKTVLRYYYGFSIVLLAAIIVLLQSRAAFIGAVGGTSIVLWKGFTEKRTRSYSALMLLLAGTGCGLFILYVLPLFLPDPVLPVILKTSSNSARFYMMRLTTELIMQSPITGQGYGSFEAVFGQLASTVWPGLEAATVTHPHNELLFAWVEGGVIALCGLVLIVTGIIMQLWERGALKWYGVALLLPVAVHMNLEYPLYQSAVYALVVVLLLLAAGVIASPVKAEMTKTGVQIKSGFTIARILLGAFSLFMVYFSFTGLITQQKLTQIEKNGLQAFLLEPDKTLSIFPNRYSQQARIDFDYHVSLLLRFNKEQNLTLLYAFQKWADNFLKTHNDPNVYDSLIKIAIFQKSSRYRYLCDEAHGRWPKDKRFICDSFVRK